MDLPNPPFIEFYRAINRAIYGRARDPFPWQARLATRVAATEEWPEEIGVPTGLGKTACLDIAVWWLASQADRAPARRTAPTRIWWLVNRRLLVDAATEHAKAIASALRTPSTGVVAAVAKRLKRLRSLSADPAGDPLEVIRLRGGITSHRPTDPSRPAVVLSTVPMYGSRLLFRGYGSSRSMRPIDAALAGIDSLVLLDEAHLAPHLRALIPALAACHPGAKPVLAAAARSRPHVAALTATGDATEGQRFDLDEDDQAHPVVRQRLDAAKPMEVRTFRTGDVGLRLAEAAFDLIEKAPAPSAVLVFANTPGTARAAFDRLRKRKLNRAEEPDEVLLLTGLAREPEAARTRERILDEVDGMPSSRKNIGRRRHLIVVATQTLEVGADVDAEYLVTEACGVRALTQRLGRLNRLGLHAHARAVYVHRNADEWPVYGSEPANVLARLQAAQGRDGDVNLSPRQIAEVLGTPGDHQGRAPEVLPGLLWEWTKTTTPPADEAPVEPYFSGIAGPEYRVSLIWRAYIPASGELLWPPAADREAVEVPIGEARTELPDDENLRRLGSDGVTVEEISRAELRPGDVVIVTTKFGRLDKFGWHPDSRDPVVDVSLEEYGLPLNAAALQRLKPTAGETEGAIPDRLRALGIRPDEEDGPDEEDIDATEQVAIVEQIKTDLAAVTPPGWKELGREEREWRDFIHSLERLVMPQNEVPRLLPRSRSDELDETSLAETAVNLDSHGREVARRSRSISESLGLAAGLTEIVEGAGRLHDVGKADRRFQRWLDPDEKHDFQVAKSNLPRHRWNAARAEAGWPRGGRHEELSARLVCRALEQRPDGQDPLLRDLLLHLIVSHHGRGRPLVLPVEDGTIRVVAGVVDDASVEAPADLSRVDWDQPARFSKLNVHFGPWGLALLEAILRQADHGVSTGVAMWEVH